MKYSLDTDTCIEYLNNPDSHVGRHLRRHLPLEIVVCSVVRAELWYGVLRSRNPREAGATVRAFLAPLQSMPFDDEASVIYGEIRSQLAQTGTPIGPNDLLIAAIAKVRRLTLVTHNTREFSRVRGLALEDWRSA